ncbi:hypothetical protein P5V15_006978 [Pogonomyrmex californicus]
MADSRILFHNIRNDCDLENIPYDSDHDAVKFDISLDDENGLELEPVITKYKYNFRKTNWEKFTETLHGKITNNIPVNRNLSIEEIYQYLKESDVKILETIEQVVPRFMEKDSINPYINDKIHKLQKQKNKLLTRLHHFRRKWPAVNQLLLENLKEEINMVRADLKMEFSISINNYWNNKIKNSYEYSYEGLGKYVPTVE